MGCKLDSEIPTEVGDRWASGLDSWCLSRGVKLKLCSPPDTLRTKLVAEAELCWSKEIRWPLLRSGKLPFLHMRRKAPWGSKREGAPPHSKCGHAPTGLCSGIHLSKNLHTHVGEHPRTSQVWTKKQGNWPNVNKDREGLSYRRELNHLFTTLLVQDACTAPWMCISVASDLLRSSSLERIPIPFLSGYVFLPCFWLK